MVNRMCACACMYVCARACVACPAGLLRATEDAVLAVASDAYMQTHDEAVRRAQAATTIKLAWRSWRDARLRKARELAALRTIRSNLPFRRVPAALPPGPPPASHLAVHMGCLVPACPPVRRLRYRLLQTMRESKGMVRAA